MEEYFSIGEVSSATKIPISTLRYYDEIGVLSPAVKDERTKYRYYSAQQIPLLRIIAHLRKLGFSTEHIKSHFSSKDYSHTEDLIEEVIFNTHLEIERLQNIERELRVTLQKFRDLDGIRKNIGKPFIEETRGIKGQVFPGPYLTLREIGKKASEIEANEEDEVSGAGIIRGIKLSVESWGKNRRIREALVSIYPEENCNDTLLIPSGKCASIYGEGIYETSEVIPNLLKWIEQEGYRPRGDIFVFFSDFYIPFKSHKDFLYTIQVPVV